MEEFLKSIGGLDRIIYSAINIAVGVLIYVIIRTVVSSWARRSEKRFQDRSRDFATVRTVVVTTSRVIILIAVVLSILAIYGVDVVAPLAGLGIGAVIIGLALQDTAKDIIGGIMILTDGKYKVGDTIQLDEETRGKVVFLSLRTTKIRSFTGKVVVIPNRNIGTITNLTAASFSLAQVKVKVAYEEDSDKVEEVLNKIKLKMDHSMPEMLEDGEIVIKGISDLADSGVEWWLTCKCKPMEHFVVQRALMREIKDQFDKSNIKIPYPQIEVHKS